MPSILDLSRMGESASAGVVSQIAADDVVDAGGVVVTAVCAADGRLKLISWRVEPSGSVRRLGDSGDQAGAASHIDIARVRGMYVSACRTEPGNLKLISWDVDDVGQITRRGDSGDAAGEADWVRIIGLRDGQVLTACRTGDFALKLISWRLNPDGSLTRMRDSGDAAGKVHEIQLVDVTRAGAAPHHIITAVRVLGGVSVGALKLIAWSLTADGSIARVGDSGDQAGEATLVRAVVHGATSQLVTSVRTGSGNLEVISWTVAPTGVITRVQATVARKLAPSAITRTRSSACPMVSSPPYAGRERP